MGFVSSSHTPPFLSFLSLKKLVQIALFSSFFKKGMKTIKAKFTKWQHTK